MSFMLSGDLILFGVFAQRIMTSGGDTSLLWRIQYSNCHLNSMSECSVEWKLHSMFRVVLLFIHFLPFIIKELRWFGGCETFSVRFFNNMSVLHYIWILRIIHYSLMASFEKWILQVFAFLSQKQELRSDTKSHAVRSVLFKSHVKHPSLKLVARQVTVEFIPSNWTFFGSKHVATSMKLARILIGVCMTDVPGLQRIQTSYIFVIEPV